MNRKARTHLALVLLGITFVLSPLFLDFSDKTGAVIFSFLVALGLCVLAFEDFREQKNHSSLFKVLAVAFVAFAAAAAAVLTIVDRGAALIPIGILGGGCLYWYIDRHVAGAD